MKKNKNENNGMWKGDKAGYYAIHYWIKSRKPKPDFCECCNKNKPHDCASISGEYKRDVNDYEWLCRSCHMRKDGRINNLKSQNTFICFKCNKKIELDIEDYVELNTYNLGRIIESVKFHINCWSEYNDARMNARLGEMSKRGLEMLKNMGVEA